MTYSGFVLLIRKCILSLVLLLAGCALPSLDGRTESKALSAEESKLTRLGQGLSVYTGQHPGKSGVLPLEDALSAFAARMLLVSAAEKTIDIQYYIWRDDTTGTLLLKALYQAAERGVRIRLLLDDNGIAGMDAKLAVLNDHPLIEVRLFNPFSVRKPKYLGFITHFSRANRRMHNKSLTADSQLTIIGGRNIGDEYFAATDGVLFADLDVMAAGDIVEAVSADFDLYWQSQSAYPLERLLPAITESQQKKFLMDLENINQQSTAALYLTSLRNSHFIEELLAGSLEMLWTDVDMVSDHPLKGIGHATESELLIYQLNQLLGQPEQRIILVSPYFIPTKAGIDVFKTLIESGVEITVLTNSFEATDVAVVHAGYAKYRKALLKMGVSLFEMRKSDSNQPDDKDTTLAGSSGSSLHAKTFAVDGKRVFIGSFNFDPRSAMLNTELGFIINSPELAAAVEQVFSSQVPARSYEVKLSDTGQLYWQEEHNGGVVIHTSEPGTSITTRAVMYFLSVLPIEWLL